jgi:hypothetical protein
VCALDSLEMFRFSSLVGQFERTRCDVQGVAKVVADDAGESVELLVSTFQFEFTILALGDIVDE